MGVSLIGYGVTKTSTNQGHMEISAARTSEGELCALCIFDDHGTMVEEGLIPQDQQQQCSLFAELRSVSQKVSYYQADQLNPIHLDHIEDMAMELSHPSGRILRVCITRSAEQGIQPGFSLLPDPSQDALTLTRYQQQQISVPKVADTAQIDLDMPRTWILKYSPDERILTAARNILVRLSTARPSIGYCQGMNSVAVAALLMARLVRVRNQPIDELDEALGFHAMTYWLDHLLPPSFWSTETGLPALTAVQAAGKVTEKLLGMRNPVLAQQLAEIFPVRVFVERALPSLLVAVVPLQTAFALWEQTTKHGAMLLVLVCTSLIEMALLPFVAPDGNLKAPLEPEQVYEAVVCFSGSCYDSSGLMERSLEYGPTLDECANLFQQEMLKHIQQCSSPSAKQEGTRWPRSSGGMVPLSRILSNNKAVVSPQSGEVDAHAKPSVADNQVPTAAPLVSTDLSADKGVIEEPFVQVSCSQPLNTFSQNQDSEMIAASPSSLRRKLHQLCASGSSSEDLLRQVQRCFELTHDHVWLANTKSKVIGDGCGSTPLISAVKNQHIHVVRLLLKAHATPTVTNWWGKSAMSYAQAYLRENPGCADAKLMVKMLQDKIEKLAIARKVSILRGCCSHFRAVLGSHVCEVIAIYQIELLKLPQYPTLKALNL